MLCLCEMSENENNVYIVDFLKKFYVLSFKYGLRYLRFRCKHEVHNLNHKMPRVLMSCSLLDHYLTIKPWI